MEKSLKQTRYKSSGPSKWISDLWLIIRKLVSLADIQPLFQIMKSSDDLKLLLPDKFLSEWHCVQLFVTYW